MSKRFKPGGGDTRYPMKGQTRMSSFLCDKPDKHYMNEIREQIGAMRRQAERYEHQQREYQAMSILDDAADTMEKMLAMVEARLGNRLQAALEENERLS